MPLGIRIAINCALPTLGANAHSVTYMRFTSKFNSLSVYRWVAILFSFLSGCPNSG